MTIIKPVAVFIKNRSYLVAKDHGEGFFKSVGGRVNDNETEAEALRRVLLEDYGYTLDSNPELIFDLPPTPAVGDPDDVVVLRGYLIAGDESDEINPRGDVKEVEWVNSETVSEVNVTGQIKDLILPELQKLNLID